MPESTFGPYRIEGVLGTGGMGEVYRAHNTRTDRAVALKLLLPHLAEDEGYRARFLRECRAAGSLSEPHVVPIHDFGEIDGRLYLEMRLVEGTDLAAWLAEHGPPEPEVAVAVVTHVAQALDAAHARGLVHRDVKPSNVLLTGVSGPATDAAEVFAYLCDFGVARSREGEGLTSAGAVPGSARYVAPERFDGVEGDPGTDVYSLACLLHEALTGRPPFDGDLPALVRAHVQDPPPSPSTQRPGLPRALDRVVATGMAKVPAQRYAGAGRLAAAARAALRPAAPRRPATVGAATGTVPAGARSATGPTPAPLPPPRVRRPAVAAAGRSGRGDRTSVPTGPVPRQAPAPAPQAPAPDRTDPHLRPPAGWRTPLVWLGAAAVAVAVGVGGAVLAAGGTGGGTGGGTAEAPPVPPPPTAQEQLLRDLPAGFETARCDPGTIEPGSDTLAEAWCDGGLGGVGRGQFTRFASAQALEQAFVTTAGRGGVVKGFDDTVELCRTGGPTRQQWGDPPGVGGEVGCYIGPDRVAHLFWTRTDTLAFCHVARTDGDAAALFEWWRSLPSVPV